MHSSSCLRILEVVLELGLATEVEAWLDKVEYVLQEMEPGMVEVGNKELEVLSPCNEYGAATSL